jgi:hypothetical protein
MSDALAALLIVVCLPLIKRHTRGSAYLLGIIAGYGFVVRESGIAVVACVLIVMTGWDRLRAAAAAAIPILGLALYNWTTFGAPWRTGQSYWLGDFHLYSLSYGLKHPWPEGGEVYYSFSLRYFHLLSHSHAGFTAVLPNIWFYPLILLGFSTVFGLPFVSLVGIVAAAHNWRKREALFTLLLAGITVLFYIPNFEQDPRYLAGPCFLLTAWACAAFVAVARWIRNEHSDRIATFLAPAPRNKVSQDLP